MEGGEVGAVEGIDLGCRDSRLGWVEKLFEYKELRKI